MLWDSLLQDPSPSSNSCALSKSSSITSQMILLFVFYYYYLTPQSYNYKRNHGGNTVALSQPSSPCSILNKPSSSGGRGGCFDVSSIKTLKPFLLNVFQNNMKIDENFTSEFFVVCLLVCFFGKGGLAIYTAHSCRRKGRSVETLIPTPRGKLTPSRKHMWSWAASQEETQRRPGYVWHGSLSEGCR